MAIRFHLATITSEQVACGYSPVLEALISLHSVLEPKHHPAQHPWARRTRALPVRLRDDLRRFAFLFDGYAPNFFAPTPVRPFPSFESELERIANLPGASSPRSSSTASGTWMCAAIRTARRVPRARPQTHRCVAR